MVGVSIRGWGMHYFNESPHKYSCTSVFPVAAGLILVSSSQIWMKYFSTKDTVSAVIPVSWLFPLVFSDWIEVLAFFLKLILTLLSLSSTSHLKSWGPEQMKRQLCFCLELGVFPLKAVEPISIPFPKWSFSQWCVFCHIADTDLRADSQQITVLSDGKICCSLDLHCTSTSIMRLTFVPLCLVAVGLVNLSSSTRCLRRRVMSSSWVSGLDTSSTSPLS